ncbi:hypothetical protein K439DRAFT_1642502 [Ramaria rubella]|nr:hypothetical protein K439DRAFT_1642502 [Ramaria rubella]
MPLLSRALDPILGIFTGVLAFYLSQTNPRTAPPHEQTLGELLRWKRDKWRRQEAEKTATADAAPQGWVP